MLTLTEFRYATVSELFAYKKDGMNLPEFPGYTSDQWGIKAHNRPWVEANGSFDSNQRIIEVGGGYSSLPFYLAQKYSLEAWIGDDFGSSLCEEELWTRWGDPKLLSKQFPSVKYVYEAFGKFSKAFPDHYFDRVFSISTLEHIRQGNIINVMKDMHRTLAPGGMELHSIDIGPEWFGKSLFNTILQRLSLMLHVDLYEPKNDSSWKWLKILEDSGVDISNVNRKNYPYDTQLLTRDTLVESYDVVYRFYPPRDNPKPYVPAASLLVIIKDV